jgi:hypothetical protein
MILLEVGFDEIKSNFQQNHSLEKLTLNELASFVWG